MLAGIRAAACSDGMNDLSSPSRATELHQRLVDALERDGSIRTPAVAVAFRAVPRHPFLPGVPLDLVYRDEAIPTKRRDGVAISSSSQPAAMAIMLEQLDVRPGHRVLEIGAGTGYNAALLAHLAGADGAVVTVDLDADIAAAARSHLATIGLGPERVRVVKGDGGLGYPDAAPYDRIVLTVGAWDVAPAWHEQLAPGGRLLLPLWFRGAQKTVAFEPTGAPDGAHLASVSVSSCAFMRLRGTFAGPEAYVTLGPDPGLAISSEDRAQVDAAELYALLTGPGRDHPVPVHLAPRDVWQGLGLWLALRQPGFCTVSADGEMARHPAVADFFGSPDAYRFTMGLVGEAALCLLAYQADRSRVVDPAAHPFPLAARSFGSDDRLAELLIAEIAAWDAAGRPTDERLRVRAYPLPTPRAPAADEIAIDKRWTRLIVAWDDGSPGASSAGAND